MKHYPVAKANTAGSSFLVIIAKVSKESFKM